MVDNVRVRLDLSSCQHSGPVKTWFLIDIRQIKTIRNLKDEVQRRNCLSSTAEDLHFLLEDFELPDCESVTLLRDGDLIFVRTNNESKSSANLLDHDWNTEHVNKKLTKKRHREEVYDDSTDPVASSEGIVTEYKKKCKKSKRSHRDVESDARTSSKRFKKKSKRMSTPEVTSSDESVGRGEMNESTPTVNCELSKDIVTNESVGDVAAVEVAQPKKKRRHRKHKKKNAILPLEAVDELPDCNNSLHTEKGDFVKEVVWNGVQPKGQHFRFENSDSTALDQRTLSENEAEKENPSLKNETLWDEKVHESHGKSNTLSPLVPSFHRKTSRSNADLRQNDTSKGYHNDILVNKSITIENPVAVVLPAVKDYQSYPLLEGPPRVGDIIAYKLLELSETYTPELSGYKEGRVIHYDPTTRDIEVKFLQPLTTTVRSGKFELVPYDASLQEDETWDEQPQVEMKYGESINLISIIEPKLVSSCSSFAE